MHITEILEVGGYLVGSHYQVRGVYGVDPLQNVLEWFHPTDPYPTQNQINTWTDELNSIIQVENNILNAKQSLKNKIDLAKNYASNIVSTFNATLDETLNQTIQPSRYDTLSVLMESQPNAFKNHFYNDIREEMGLNFPTILTSATATQQRQYCVYIRTWITQMAFLLSLYKT